MKKKQHTTMDLMVLVVVLALIAGVFFKYHALNSLPESVPFTYQMELLELEEGTADTLTPGDTVICDAGKQPVGVVEEVHTGGGLVVLTIRSDGYPIEGGFRTNVYDILPGFQQRFFTDSVSWEGSILSIP